MIAQEPTIPKNVFTTAHGWQDTVTRNEKIFGRYKANKPRCIPSYQQNWEYYLFKRPAMADLEHKCGLNYRISYTNKIQCLNSLLQPLFLKKTDRFIQDLHFIVPSLLSLTRNLTIFFIKDKGNGLSCGNWIEPSAVSCLASSLANAFIADGIG